MKILFINKTLSGPMEQLARFLTLGRGSTSVFMAERWSRDAQLPGCSLVRIASTNIDESSAETISSTAPSAENMMLRNIRNGACVKILCQSLAQHGFVPDVIYATAQDGYALNVREVFPKVRMVVRLDWFFPPRGQSLAKEQDPLCFAYKTMYNSFIYTLLAQCAVGITASHWQKQQLDEGLKSKICVINNGVDTHFFVPPNVPRAEEIVTFSCHGKSSSRGAHIIFKCLPQLLGMRPQCKVNIVSFASRKSFRGKMQHCKELTSLLPPLNTQQRQRVTILSSPPAATYLSLLQHSTLYVYLTAPSQLSAGIMEAMSSGALVLASPTEAVCELVTSGENGLLWEGNGAQDLAFTVAETCAKAAGLQGLRHNARATILEKHNLGVLLQQHAEAVLHT